MVEQKVNDKFLRQIIFNNETHFYLSDYANKRNGHISGSSNPHVVYAQICLRRTII